MSTSGRHPSHENFAYEDSEANFPSGEVGVEDGACDNSSEFYKKLPEDDRDYWIEVDRGWFEDDPEYSEEDQGEPDETYELPLFTGCVSDDDEPQAYTNPKAIAKSNRVGIHGLKISLMGALMVSASLSRRSTGAFTFLPLGWQNPGANRVTDRTVAVFSPSPNQPDQNLIQNKPYPSASTGITDVASIAFPLGDQPSEGLDNPDSLERHPLEIDLRPAIGSLITSPLRSVVTRLVANAFVANADLLVPISPIAMMNLWVNPVSSAIQIIESQRSPWVYPTDASEVFDSEGLPESPPVRYPITKPGEIDRSIPIVPILQTTVWDGAGGQKVFEIGDPLTQPQQYVIYNFDLVGTGSNPSIEVRKGLDALKFIGDGFTADKLQLNQRGLDLVITFTGNELVEVILKDRQREDFDNLGLKPVEGIDSSFGVGNILFNTDRVIRDTIDVFNAVLPNPNAILSPFNPNTTTFFNDQNNLIQGLDNSNDIIRGLGGDDVIFGLGGDDRISGDAGNDILFGNAGNNILTGGSGSDIFALSCNGFSRVTDFNVYEGDRIGLTDGLTVDRLSVETEVTVNGSTTWISDRFTRQRLIELPGITSMVLTRDLFVPISSQINDYRR